MKFNVKKIKKILIVLILLIVPINVNAGIICNDGWESSCVVSGPGCCSHHGGVDFGDSFSSDDSFFEQIDDDEALDIFGFIVLSGFAMYIVYLFVVIIPTCFGTKDSRKKQFVIEEETENIQENNDIVEEIESIDENEKMENEVIEEVANEPMKKSDYIVMWTFIIFIVFIIGLSIYLSNKYEKYEIFVNYVIDNVADEYIENKSEIIEEKIYVRDFYNNSSSFDNIKDYYEELLDEVKDDYIIIVKYDDKKYHVFYYKEENKKEELVDYMQYFASQYYVENIKDEDWKEKRVKLSFLNDSGYIKSEYFHEIYKELETSVANDEIIIYSNITDDNIYETDYIYSNE